MYGRSLQFDTNTQENHTLTPEGTGNTHAHTNTHTYIFGSQADLLQDSLALYDEYLCKITPLSAWS